MKSKDQKTIIGFFCFLGILCLGYGVGKENNAIFIVGLICIIIGYLLIRKKLKESIKKKP